MKNLMITMLLCLIMFSYSNAQTTSSWTQMQAVGASAPAASIMRTAAVGFSIGNKGYTGTGKDANGNPLKDFWEYEPTSNTWTQKADLAGPARDYAVGFSIGPFGYVGTGKDSAGSLLNDFWQYNPSTNVWTQKANFGGTPRLYSVGFNISNYGYLGLGDADSSDMQSDFWQYNPSNDTWVQKARFAGVGRRNAIGFNIGAEGYVGIGADMSSILQKDFWQYDPATDSWVQKADFGGGAWELAVAFSISNYGYVGTGYSNASGSPNYNSYNKNDFWQYDPSTNTWDQLESFGGHARYYACGFSMGNKGYIGTGQYFYFDSSNVYHSESLNDFWAFSSCSKTTSNLVTQIGAVDSVLAKLLAYSVTLSNGSAAQSLQWTKNSLHPSIDSGKISGVTVPGATHAVSLGHQCFQALIQMVQGIDTLSLMHKNSASIDAIIQNDASVNIYGYTNRINVAFNDFSLLDELTLNIYDIAGRKVLPEQQVSTGNTRHTIGLNVNSGYYLVVIDGNNYQKVEKVFLTNN